MNKIFDFFKNTTKQSKNHLNEQIPPDKNEENIDTANLQFSTRIEVNLETVKRLFSYGVSADIKIRNIKIGERKAFILFIEGMVNTSVMDTNILAPLMLMPKPLPSLENILNSLITHNQAIVSRDFTKIASSVNFGDCAIFVDGIDAAIICDVKSWDRRGINPPLTEAVIIGPHEGFNENFKINTALVRKVIRSENLIIENLSVGKISQTTCAFMYMKNIVNEDFVEELRRRINNIDVDYLYQVSELEQFIEDSTFSPFPQMIKTERPDKTAEALIEGKIAVILQGSPFALLLPITASEFLTTAEDKNLRFPYANLSRLVRMAGVLISLFLPSLYLAAINFHHEMIPTDLLLSIEATREAVPFSALFELLLMEISFDLIREASIRVPSPVGSTLGIIGGLIIGQAAVSANIVSPITIVVVALAGIGSFSTPDYSAAFGFRLLRYFYTLLASMFGVLGISFGIYITICTLSATKSLGISMMTTLDSGNETNVFKYIFSPPSWKNEYRHKYLKAKHPQKQGKISRKWAK